MQGAAGGAKGRGRRLICGGRSKARRGPSHGACHGAQKAAPAALAHALCGAAPAGALALSSASAAAGPPEPLRPLRLHGPLAGRPPLPCSQLVLNHVAAPAGAAAADDGRGSGRPAALVGVVQVVPPLSRRRLLQRHSAAAAAARRRRAPSGGAARAHRRWVADRYKAAAAAGLGDTAAARRGAGQGRLRSGRGGEIGRCSRGGRGMVQRGVASGCCSVFVRRRAALRGASPSAARCQPLHAPLTRWAGRDVALVTPPPRPLAMPSLAPTFTPFLAPTALPAGFFPGLGLALDAWRLMSSSRDRSSLVSAMPGVWRRASWRVRSVGGLSGREGRVCALARIQNARYGWRDTALQEQDCLPLRALRSGWRCARVPSERCGRGAARGVAAAFQCTKHRHVL
jgi:hypothetical protein